jgi:hypothetical protein
MVKPTLEQIKNSILENGFTLFNAPFSCNLGGIRTLDNESGKFNDWLFCFYFDQNHKLVGEVVPGTTDAGIYYREHPMNKNGTAIIVHNKQHRSVYQLQDPAKNRLHIGHNRQKAFRQIKPMEYWRDNDKDSVLDFGGKTYTEMGFTNGHYMGTVGVNVGNWSAGCWGATVENMNKLFSIAQTQIDKFRSDIFSFTLIHESSFKK